MQDQTTYRNNWQKAKQAAEARGLRIIEHGWEQHVIIDETKGLIYRYPRRHSASARLNDEVAVLAYVNQQEWPVAVPVMQEHTPIYTSYTYIPGEVYSKKMQTLFTEREAERLGDSIGRFLAQFHTLEHEVVNQKKTKHTTSLLEYYEQRIRQGYTNINPRYYELALQQLNRLVERPHLNEQVVVHGDLHGFNMIIDPAEKRLVGIIDLSEMEIGEPHQDFRKLFMTDPRILTSALDAYSKAGGPKLSASTIQLWAYVNEWANLCYFSHQPAHPTYQRALANLRLWQQL